VIILASWRLRVEALFESGLQREETKERGVVGRRSGDIVARAIDAHQAESSLARSVGRGTMSGRGRRIPESARARDDEGAWNAWT
jgi:hypothetical protein